MSPPMRVFLGGEGPNELGGWYVEPEYRADSPAPGVIEALLTRVRAEGWQVIGAVSWAKIRKYRPGGHADAERRCVEGLALMARERGAEVVAFSRDTDGDRARGRSIDAGIASAEAKFPDGPRIAGGAAVPTVEAWIASLAGRDGAEGLSRAKLIEAMASLGLAQKQTRDYVGVIAGADLIKLPADAASLRTWLTRARAALLVA